MPRPELSTVDDEVLVGRARMGDRDAFGELVGRHQRAALRVAAVISGSTEDASDIVQDAMVKVHRGLGSFRGTSAARSWILRVVANEAKNHVRGRVRRLARDDRSARGALDIVDPVESDALDRVEHEEIAAALARLGAADRAVLGCRFVADLSEAETAEVLGVPRGTVKSRTARALTRLRRQLEGSG